MILHPVPVEFPDPDCFNCGGEGIPQSRLHQILGEDYANMACSECWGPEEEEE